MTPCELGRIKYSEGVGASGQRPLYKETLMGVQPTTIRPSRSDTLDVQLGGPFATQLTKFVILAADLLRRAAIENHSSQFPSLPDPKKIFQIPAIPANRQSVERRALGPNHTRKVAGVDLEELHHHARLLVNVLGVLGLIAAMDLAAVALRVRRRATGSRSSEGEKRGSGGEGDDAGEHLR